MKIYTKDEKACRIESNILNLAEFEQNFLRNSLEISPELRQIFELYNIANEREIGLDEFPKELIELAFEEGTAAPTEYCVDNFNMASEYKASIDLPNVLSQIPEATDEDDFL